MALNAKQKKHISDMQELSEKFKDLYPEAFTLKEQFDEIFSTGDSNDLSIEDLGVYGFTYTDLQAFSNQVLGNYINFWTNSAVTTQEYGKYARAILP